MEDKKVIFAEETNPSRIGLSHGQDSPVRVFNSVDLAPDGSILAVDLHNRREMSRPHFDRISKGHKVRWIC